jgi:hypothetical protein
MFCLPDVLSLRMFCPAGRFVPPDVLSQYIMDVVSRLHVASLGTALPDGHVHEGPALGGGDEVLARF